MIDPPLRIVNNGKPIFGAFSHPPKELDISDVRNPYYTLKMPRFLSKLRIRADISVAFTSDEYTGIITLLDVKYFCFTEIVIWEKSTGKKYAYRYVFGFRRLVSKNLVRGRSFTFRKKRYVRVSWDRAKNRVSVVFTMQGDNVRPSFSADFRFDMTGDKAAEWFSVTPAPIKRRCSATYFCAAHFKGYVMNHNTGVVSKQSENNICFFDIRRIFSKLRTWETFATGMGHYEDKQLVLRLASTNHDATENDRYNDNALFLDNDITLLPPVMITCPYGVDGKWIIQDTENMIDLYFTPLSDHRRVSSIFILTADYHTVYGTFEGDLKTKSGEILHLKDFPGIAQKQYLRM